MRKIFFDIAITGHHAEYINHLVEYLCENTTEINYIFVLHPNFKESFPEIVSKGMNCLHITWLYVTQQELELCYSGNLIRRSFNQYKILNKYALENKVSHAVILYFNTLQFALIFTRPVYTVSGILFLQFYRMQVKTFKEKLKYYRKYYTTYLYALNKKITKVYILNDEKSADFLNKKFNIEVFQMLPDPIPNLTPLANFNIYEHYKISKDRKIFLHIGSLGERKGTFEIIDAALHIPLKNQKEIVILLIGKVDDNKLEELFYKRLKEVNENCNLVLLWDNQFVSNAMMKSLFEQCYAVLMPYKNTEASSGILGHAAAANKMVISTGKGLLKELIENYKLGLLVNEVTPKEIAEKMLESYNYKLNKNLLLQFMALHKTFFFAKELLENE